MSLPVTGRLPAVRTPAAAQRARSFLGRVRAEHQVRRAPVDLDAAWEFTQTFRRGALNVRPIQVRSEFMAFLELVREQQPRRVIEIGTANGGSLFLVSRAAAPAAKIVSVDMPGGPFGGGYPRTALRMIRAASVAKQDLRLISGDSRDPVTVAAVKAFAAPADLLFIDGDHTFEGVTSDFENYSPLVKPDGLVAFHDIVPGPASDVGEVPRFWSDLKHAYRHTEFVEDWEQGAFGIGVLHI